VHNVKSSDMPLPVCDNTSTAHVTSTRDHNDITRIEFHEIKDLALLEVELDGVVHFDGGVRVTDCSSIVGDNMRNTFRANGNLANFKELVGCLLGCDAVDCKSALYVVEESEVLAGLFDGDDIHETSRVCVVSSDFSIHLDETLHHDSSNLTAGQCIFQTIPEENGQREAFAQFVGTRRGTGSVGAAKLVEHP